MKPQIPRVVLQAIELNEQVQRSLASLDLMGIQRATDSIRADIARQIGVEAFAAEIARTNLENARRLASVSQPALDAAQLRAQIDEDLKAVLAKPGSLTTIIGDLAPHQKLFEQVRAAAQELSRAYRRSLPSNWQTLDAEGQEKAIDLATDDGLCLVWAPREDVVAQLVSADDEAARDKTLVANREAILEDIAAVLGDATHYVSPAHADATTLATKAVAASRAGHDEAAQSLAAAALGRVLHDVQGFEKLGGAYKEFSKRDLEQTVIQLLRITLIELATARSLTNTDAHTSGFNRHGTLHGRPEFFSAPDCLEGLLLVTAWLRELAWWQEHHPEALTDEHS